MGSMELEEVSRYLLTKFSALLKEAEKDPSRLICISRFRNAETLIKSKYDNSTASISSFGPNFSNDLVIRDLLYELISALSECRVFAQQHRGVAPKHGFLLFKHFWFIGQTNRRLDDLEKKLNSVLGPSREHQVSSGQMFEHQVSSGQLFDTDDEDFSSGLIGLEKAAEKVIELLGMENENGVMKGIGIVGIAGSGKTALTRKVFDSSEVRNIFSPRIWVSLSGTLYDEPVSADLRVKILRKMLVQAGCDVSELVTTYVGIPKLTEKLYHRLMGKRYLIVLDEVWHVNEWYADLDSESPKGNAFGDCISHGLPKDHGGRIIVTSRRGGVAREMIGRENLIPIDTLLDQDICSSVFSDAVTKYGKHDLQPEMVEEISKRCVGLPLAAGTLAEII